MGKVVLIALIFFLAAGKAGAQKSAGTSNLMKRLDSVCHSNSIAGYFADIYFRTTDRAIDFFSGKDEAAELIERLELRFASYFFRSADAYQNKADIPEAWKTYYTDSAAPSLRYILLGINAHINGEIWQALTSEFSLEEIRQLKQAYFSYNRSLKKEYNDIYASALASSSRIRLIHTISFGLDRWYGKQLLKRWRRRQMKLAELYYTDPDLFKRKLERLKVKMDRLNKLITTYI